MRPIVFGRRNYSAEYVCSPYMRIHAAINECLGRIASSRPLMTRAHNQGIASVVDGLIDTGYSAGNFYSGKARRLLVEAERRARSANYLQGLATSLRRLAWLDLSDGLLDTAICRASEASFIASANRITEWPNAFGAQYVINTVHGQVGQFAEAEAGWHRLLDLSHLHSDDLRQADSLESLSRLRISQGRLQEALNLKHAALAVHERLNDAHAVMTLNNIAHTHLLLGQFGDAHLTASNAFKRCPGNRLGFRATLLQTMGTAQLHRGQLDEAEKLFAEGMKLAAMPGQERSLVVSYMIGNGMLACARSSVKAGTAALKKALTHAQRWQLVTSQVEALEALTKAYQQAGDANMAQQYAAQHAALVQKLGIERNRLQVRVTNVAPVVADLRAQWLTRLRFA